MLNIKIKHVNTIAWWLLVVGGINWGMVGFGNLIGAGNWNLIQMLLGPFRAAADFVYLFVGVSALWLVWAKFSK